MEIATDKLSPRQSLIPQKSDTLVSDFLRDGSIPAKVVYLAAKKLLGDISHWECETVEIELKRKLGDSVPEENLAKIFSCMALDAHDNLIIDQAHVFKNFAVAFNNESPIADMDEVIHVGQALWTLIAFKIFDPHKHIYLDYEPITYLAKLLHHEGFMLAPEGMGFVQEQLNSLNRNLDLIPEIKAAIKDNQASKNPLVVEQIRKLSQAREYAALMMEDQETTLREISGDK